MSREGSPEVTKVMEVKDSKENPEKESDPDFDYYADLTDEELARKFEKLTPADKIRYKEWFDFHSRYQKNTGIGGTRSSEEYLTKINHSYLMKSQKENLKKLILTQIRSG